MTNYNKKYKCIKSYPKGPEIGRIFNPHKGWGYTLDWMKENPDLINDFFEEVIDWDALLEEAKRRYPNDTKIKSFNTGNVRTIDCVAHNSKKDKYICSRSPSYEWANIPGEESNPFLYKEGKWAEIIEPNIVTEDGAKLYEGDIYWFVPTEKLAIWSNKEVFAIYGNNTLVCENKNSFAKGVKVFSCKQAAEVWIKKNKPVEKEYEILATKGNGTLDIYSIKRRFDGELFNLGDLVSYKEKCSYLPWVIHNFIITEDGCLARNKDNTICELITSIKHVKEYKYYSLPTIISNIEDCKNRVSISNGGEYIQTDELIERLKNDKT